MFGWIARRIIKPSPLAQKVVELWQNSLAQEWTQNSFAICHIPTGVGVWIGNEIYGLSVYMDVPSRDRAIGHILGGKKIRLGYIDRHYIHENLVVPSKEAPHHKVISQIDNWITGAQRNASC